MRLAACLNSRKARFEYSRKSARATVIQVKMRSKQAILPCGNVTELLFWLDCCGGFLRRGLRHSAARSASQFIGTPFLTLAGEQTQEFVGDCVANGLWGGAAAHALPFQRTASRCIETTVPLSLFPREKDCEKNHKFNLPDFLVAIRLPSPAPFGSAGLCKRARILNLVSIREPKGT
jgi:hypothetical protein